MDALGMAVADGAGRESALASARAWLEAQAWAQADRWTLWTPVAFGGGCALYFTLLREPQPWVAWALLPVVLGLLVATRWSSRRLATIALVLGACLVGGFSTAKLRADAVKAPVAQAGGQPQWVEAWVVDIASPGQGGHRLLLAPIRVGDWPAQATPIRMRVTLRPDTPLPRPGEAVRLLAILNPPPPPASPGAYDFARDAYFESVGAVGLALRPPGPVQAEAPPPWRLGLTMRVNAIRWSLTDKIVQALGPETGGLAAAMTTGHEAFIPRQQIENLRDSGLAHIVSISGLHMAIVGGFVFAAVRLLVAAWPWLALRVSGKKVAACVGLAAVGGYLVLSGAPPPAERAAITAAVAFLAVLADRQAISLHALALAAMAVLLLQPEAITGPGFQMSFAATAALVALAEIWPRPVREIDVPWPIRWAQTAATWTAASLAVSFVAGLATGPFAIQHFNRVATWGLFANLAVAPISSFLMMPGLALGATLTPFGLGQAPLEVAGWSIALMNRVAETAASAPFAQAVIPSAPGWVLPVSFLGLLFVCLWAGPLRWAGLLAATAILWAPRPPPPDVWVAADGAAVAVREGRAAVLMRPDVKLFGAELWARRRGLTPLIGEAERDARFACDRWSCAAGADAPVRVSAAWNLRRPLKPGRLEELCAGADLVILRNDMRPETCGARLVLSERDFLAGGSVELWRTGQGWRAGWAQTYRGRRPWTWGYDPR
ncbi:ComEC/Rec2 family competence protein [Phenylobacterium sp. SCN 70-31]|uniref:ComEC/Rec2 family competence protein n=1 Tax=Phenylobacterium sp. SCN 70-31 TaxID=1660129 RepID=UPI0025FC435E|nr:ComEC/Rec2 family competence protein [Phenylobacterium sp. SCN 70-31]